MESIQPLPDRLTKLVGSNIIAKIVGYPYVGNIGRGFFNIGLVV